MVKKLFGFNKKNGIRGDSESDKEKNEGVGSRNNSTDNKVESSIHDDRSTRISSSVQSSSIFSKGRRTYNSGDSSLRSSTGKNGNPVNEYRDLGTPLRIIDSSRYASLATVNEEEQSTTDQSLDCPVVYSNQNSNKEILTMSNESHYLVKAIKNLENNLLDLMDDVHQNVTNISRAVICATEYFKNFIQETSLPSLTNGTVNYRVKMESCPSVRGITKIIFHFYDNLLNTEAYSNSRSILFRRYLSFLKKIEIQQDTTERDAQAMVLPSLKIFPIDDSCNLPHKDRIYEIMEDIIKSDTKLLSEDEGSFIAAVLRGVEKDASILSIVFGLPTIRQEHQEMIKALYGLFPDVHFYCIQDYIKPAATIAIMPELKGTQQLNNINKEEQSYRFSPPYRTLENGNTPPISLSISTQNSLKMSGTLGGYVYPQVDSDSKLAQYAGATFAITCAHVVLAESQDYPEVAVPSRVLQKSYHKTLLEESSRYPQGSKEQRAFADEALQVERSMKLQNQEKFGQVVWGERSIINQRLSDFAIIKVNPSMDCKNFLGNNLAQVPDPTLKFENVYVKKKIMKIQPGTKVFKIGASTGYTTGVVNAVKLIYWADGKLQSSEFIVSSPQPLFASGGDSGAWILTKLEDRVGLGVLGMLHSYDGERKQFGLFTPIGDILERLHTVTGIYWDIDRMA
ncbi:Peptidase family S64 [Nakaseomyces glabratus]